MRRIARVWTTVSFLALGLLASRGAGAQETPATPTADPSKVRVVFTPSEPHVVLEQRPAVRRGDHVDSEGSTAICVAQCDVMLDPKVTYQVGGTWVTPAAFNLPAGQPGPFRVRATPGSSRSDGIGTGLLFAAAGTLFVGGVGALVLLTTGVTKNAEAGSAPSQLLTVSLTTAAVGLVLLAVSLPFRSAGTTKVTVEPYL